MNLGGWITFLISTLGVTSLFAWCVYKVLTAKNPQKIHGIENTEEMEDDIFEEPRRVDSKGKARR